jgi:hypothetical protein
MFRNIKAEAAELVAALPSQYQYLTHMRNLPRGIRG